MRRRAGLAVSIASVLAAAMNFMACGSSTPNQFTSGGGPLGGGSSVGGSSAGGSATSGAGAPNQGAPLDINVGNMNSVGIGEGGVEDSCAAHVSTAELVPLDMYIMLDVSSSMLDLTASNISKWDAVKSALESFLNDSTSAGLGVGLQYFPLVKTNAPPMCSSDADCAKSDSGNCFLNFCWNFPTDGGLLPCEVAADCGAFGPCVPLAACGNGNAFVCNPPGADCGAGTDGKPLGACTKVAQSTCEHTASCDAAAYAAPAQPIAVLPGAAAALTASINAKTPNGQTPTAPALTGAIQQASAWAKAHPNHRVVAVLATDGLPTECTPTDINQVAAIAAQGVAATPSIDTFVIGVFGQSDIAAGSPTNLDTIAMQGGTKNAFIVDTTKDVTTQFLAALDTIRSSKLECAFKIPQPTGTDALDYRLVNVQFSTGGKASTVFYVKNAAGCDANSGGWYYDVDPDSGGTPTQIIACPTSCTTFQSAQNASVQIALGCQRAVK